MRLATRIPPVILLGLGVAYGLAARRYTIPFVTDPLGPRAAPLFFSSLLTVCSLLWLLRPSPSVAWPDRSSGWRVGLTVAALGGYAVALDPLGFVLSTALFAGIMSRLAGGPFVAGAGAGLGFAAALYYLLVFALDLPLPIGRVFPFLGG